MAWLAASMIWFTYATRAPAAALTPRERYTSAVPASATSTQTRHAAATFVLRDNPRSRLDTPRLPAPLWAANRDPRPFLHDAHLHAGGRHAARRRPVAPVSELLGARATTPSAPAVSAQPERRTAVAAWPGQTRAPADGGSPRGTRSSRRTALGGAATVRARRGRESCRNRS